MGIGETIKNVFGDSHDDVGRKNSTNESIQRNTGGRHARGMSDASGHSSSSQEPLSDTDRSPHYGGSKLPAGTGIGTSGHPDRSVGDNTNTSRSAAGAASGMASKLAGKGDHAGVFADHSHGHHKSPIAGMQLPGEAQHDTNQLKHVTHENVRHVETEEVTRQKEHERHVHHVKHHVQPVTHKEVRDEQHHDMVHPITRVHERHATKDEDTRFLKEQVTQHRDTIVHGDKERTVVDKGTIVNERVHHHVHHVVQPVIEKETVDRHRTHTIIPSHEMTHEAPIIHQSEAHAPVSMEAFTKSGGSLTGGVGHDSIGSKILHTGPCERKVDGLGEQLAEKLHLGGTHGVSNRGATAHGRE